MFFLVSQAVVRERIRMEYEEMNDGHSDRVSWPRESIVIPETLLTHMSNEKKPGWLGYIGDENLPSYIGIIINHYKDP